MLSSLNRKQLSTLGYDKLEKVIIQADILCMSEIIDNEAELPDYAPDTKLQLNFNAWDINVFLMIGNAQNFLDVHYMESIQSKRFNLSKFGHMILDGLRETGFFFLMHPY